MFLLTLDHFDPGAPAIKIYFIWFSDQASLPHTVAIVLVVVPCLYELFQDLLR